MLRLLNSSLSSNGFLKAGRLNCVLKISGQTIFASFDLLLIIESILRKWKVVWKFGKPTVCLAKCLVHCGCLFGPVIVQVGRVLKNCVEIGGDRNFF